MYDSLGEPHVLQFFFVKTDSTVTGNENEWQVFATLDEKPFSPAGAEETATPYTPLSTFQFDASGLPLNTD
ncbi:flagellar basal body FlgE domain-containing protein, partial [Streptomyces scabiei]|uniref:flagellar basal body FlgE domain-containing protein n=1 Tax=Streptomyces scabiei TaxID=1930 RepID=UPI0038F69993